MEYLLENILNMVGFLVGLCIGLASYLGYKNTGSPVLFRMSVAFLSIAIGFLNESSEINRAWSGGRS